MIRAAWGVARLDIVCWLRSPAAILRRSSRRSAWGRSSPS